MTAHLWVELGNTDDADLFVGVEKWDGRRHVGFEGSYGFGRDRVTTGGNGSRCAARRRHHAGLHHAAAVGAGEVVPVRVDLGPSATHFAAGQSIRLVVAGRWLWPRNPLTGQFPAAYEPLRAGRCVVRWAPDRPSRLVVPVISRS